MLNTPKLTSAFADIAKYRALVKTIRAVSGQALNIIVQPRAGLSFFSVDQEVAKAQLAAVSGLMTDLDPNGTTPAWSMSLAIVRRLNWLILSRLRRA